MQTNASHLVLVTSHRITSDSKYAIICNCVSLLFPALTDLFRSVWIFFKVFFLSFVYSYHRLPTARNISARSQWIKSIETHQNLSEFDLKGYFRICELHFEPKSIAKKGGGYRLKEGALPIFFPYKQT